MRELDLSTTSNPVMVAARHYGISPDFSYLISDMMLATIGDELGRQISVWPSLHVWHRWAATEGAEVHGSYAIQAFGFAMLDHHLVRYGAEYRRRLRRKHLLIGGVAITAAVGLVAGAFAYFMGA